ncbi:hypothetical protein [Pseudoroseicyclus tamaricis]|uniref:Uncharacterized protein n=1 Tax=Pseudoroseicyclus tamaricis TaxID=2705421 RepID=A0A6B2JWI3_9RHOB|nr:hypothetical protein [Pseudoroseicyclus tamaricis]NDV00574.1 hypothetical protein [Pseudoroseicyclus tamaricis]
MAMLSRTLRLTGELEPEIETIEFARSVLAEIEAFGPDFGLSGEYGQRFSYRVNFEETASSEPTRFDGVVDLVQATIEVTDRHSDHEPAQFVQIFAMTGGP